MIACVLSHFSCVRLFRDPGDCGLPDSPVHGSSPGKNTGVGCHALLQGIFPAQDRTTLPALAGGFFTTSTT